MASDRLRVLLVIEQCNPEMSSVPNEGYQYFRSISQWVDATLVTHERNRTVLEKLIPHHDVVYISESDLVKRYYRLVERLTTIKGKVNWPLLNAFGYLMYEEFNHRVYQRFQAEVQAGKYDIVHALTPMMPRYPVKLVRACQRTPFVLGPVNGGVPFPKGFEQVARKEFAYFNFLRSLGQLIPGYRETYQKADKVLAGSTYTLEMLQERFQVGDRLQLFYENGVLAEFFEEPVRRHTDDLIHLLFVGRLVPYKGADILLEALGRIKDIALSKTRLTIVGDGVERESLQALTASLGLKNIVEFTGWVTHLETRSYYSQSDVFCFPSIREFGGAVVLEAMSCGLPCIVADNGGIGEYVTGETGFKIAPQSREYLVAEIAAKIQLLVENGNMRRQMSRKAVERARQFEWGQKASEIAEIYQTVLDSQQSAVPKQVPAILL